MMATTKFLYKPLSRSILIAVLSAWTSSMVYAAPLSARLNTELSTPPVFVSDLSNADQKKDASVNVDKNPTVLSTMLPSDMQVLVDTNKPFFREIARRALDHSNEVRGGASAIAAAQEDVTQARGQRYPQVSVGLDSPTYRVGQSGGQYNDTSLQVNVVTPIYDWGRVSADIDSRTQNVTSTEMQLELIQEQIVFNAIANTIELARSHAQLNIANQYVARMDELVTLLTQIVAVDVGRGSELTHAQTRRLQALTARDAIEARIRDLEVALLRVVGGAVYIPENLQWRIETYALDDASLRITSHPSLKQAESDYQAALANLESLKASHLPQVNLNVSKSTGRSYSGDSSDVNVGINLNWQPYQGGSASASERAAANRAQTLVYQKATLQQNLENQIKAVSTQRDSALIRSKEYSRLVQASDQVRDMFYQQWFHLGRRPLLDVLSAESDYFGNQQNLLNLNVDAYLLNLRLRSDSGQLIEWLDL